MSYVSNGSIVGSARHATSVTFDLIGDVAESAAKLVRTSTKAIDMLEAQVDHACIKVISDCKLATDTYKSVAVITAATAEVDQLAELFSRTGKAFDKAAAYDAAFARLSLVSLT